MPSPQDTANQALAQWQALRSEGISPGERLDVLMREFFSPPSPLDCEYEITLRNVAFEMEAA